MLHFAITSSTLPALGLVAVFCITLLAVALVGRRSKRMFAPAGRQKMNRLLFPVWLAVAAVFAFPWLYKGKPFPWNLPLLGLLVLVSGYEAFLREPTPDEDRQNWLCDTSRCGRCGYDLTANVSGICPECGMSIPRSPAGVQPPWWAAWWLQWHIDHLDNWRTTFATVAGFAVLFAALTAWLAFGKATVNLIALMPGLVCLNMAINCVRILQYLQRTKSR